MCYSKEFSFVSGLGMSISSYYFWFRFVWLKNITDQKIVKRAKALRPFIVNTIFAYACIAGHQIGEYFSILTGSHFIYKLGLISSILSVYFGAKALEKLTKARVGSKAILFVIGLVSLSIFLTDFRFENRHFWVRGDNHTLWSTTWFGLWTYAMVTGLYLSRFYQTTINKKLLRWAFLGVMNVSFLFSLGYAILGGLSTSFVTCTQDLFAGFVFGKDFPSIWCTFSVVQAPFIYMGLMAFVKNYDTKDELKINDNFFLRAAIIILATLAFLYLAKIFIPIIFGVGWKMISK